MFTMILISSAALIVAVVGCVVIWGFDASRAEEIAHTPDRTDRTALGRSARAIARPARAAMPARGASSTR